MGLDRKAHVTLTCGHTPVRVSVANGLRCATCGAPLRPVRTASPQLEAS